MDNDVDAELTFPEESDDELQNESNEPWQCGLTNLQERAVVLSKNGNFTDITLTFPGSDITYGVHCLILAISSPVFEGILYGPMKTEEENIELHGDDPLIMEYVLAYCYGYDDLGIPDMDTALEVYKLADKYILDDLKNRCCKYIVSHMSKDNVKDAIEFAEKFNFTAFLKYNCVPYFKDMFEDIQEKFKESSCYEDEPDYTVSSSILMDLNDDWLELLIPEVCVKVLDFHESWKYPESPLIYNRLSIILSNKWYVLNKFYGCINAENINQFPLHYSTMDLCLSVTDPHHAKRVIEAINQQNRFEKHLIAIHIRCEEVWPRNWLPLRTERTHRPSMLLISDADDNKVPWVIEAAKALLPQSEGSYTKEFTRDKYDEDGNRDWDRIKPVNVLKLPRSKFTLNGLITLFQGLNTSGVQFNKLQIQSSHVSSAQQNLFQQYRQKLQCLPMDHNFFRKVFEEFPIIEY